LIGESLKTGICALATADPPKNAALADAQTPSKRRISFIPETWLIVIGLAPAWRCSCGSDGPVLLVGRSIILFGMNIGPNTAEREYDRSRRHRVPPILDRSYLMDCATRSPRVRRTVAAVVLSGRHVTPAKRYTHKVTW
jgi:hypothetical protein